MTKVPTVTAIAIDMTNLQRAVEIVYCPKYIKMVVNFWSTQIDTAPSPAPDTLMHERLGVSRKPPGANIDPSFACEISCFAKPRPT